MCDLHTTFITTPAGLQEWAGEGSLIASVTKHHIYLRTVHIPWSVGKEKVTEDPAVQQVQITKTNNLQRIKRLQMEYNL